VAGVVVFMRKESEIPFDTNLSFDVCRPDGEPSRVVVIISGYPDEGFLRVAGCRFKDLPSNVAWCERFAAAGAVGVAYTNRDPVRDAVTLIDHLREQFAGVPLALWACSGNVPVALWLLAQRPEIDRAALLYGYTFGCEDAAAKFRFANPAAAMTANDLPRSTELLVVRAGRDEMPRLNETLDGFVAAALTANLPLRVLNLPDAPHAFDATPRADEWSAAIAEIASFVAAR
jgi:hypothetical protein